MVVEIVGRMTTYHHGSRRSGAGETVDCALGQISEADGDTRVGFRLECHGGVVAHLDHVGRVYDRETIGRTILRSEALFDPALIAEKYYATLGVYGVECHDCALDYRLGSEITAHRINSYL